MFRERERLFLVVVAVLVDAVVEFVFADDAVVVADGVLFVGNGAVDAASPFPVDSANANKSWATWGGSAELFTIFYVSSFLLLIFLLLCFLIEDG